MSFNRSVALRTLILFAPILIISTITFTVFLSVYKKLDLDNIYESQQNILTLQKQKTTNSFQGIFSDLLFLKNNSTFVQYLNDPYKNSFYLSELLLTFSENKKIYDQIRLLDSQGNEEIRINFHNGKAFKVPADKLLDKSEKPYFKYSENLDRNTIYISRLDLNMEAGQIEVPHKPTIRFAMPVFDYDDQFRGVLVINYLAKYVLKAIREHESFSYGKLSLLDSKGNWLISENPDNEFSFMFGDGNSFRNDYPEIWDEVYLKEHGTYTDKSKGIFFYDTLRPVPTLASEESDVVDLSFSSEIKYTPAGYQWKIVTHLSPEFFSERYRNITIFSFTVYASVNLALLLGSIIIAYIRSKQKRMEAEHKKLQREYIVKIQEGSNLLKQQVEQTQ